MDPEQSFIGPPCPQFCEAGPHSHRWVFEWSACDGATLDTPDCVICNRGVNGPESNDWPHEYLTINVEVTLESFTEVGGYYEPEYDHYVVMTPTPENTDSLMPCPEPIHLPHVPNPLDDDPEYWPGDVECNRCNETGWIVK